MFGSFGWMELVLILIIVLIIFGAGKLPQLGEGLGKAIKGFKKTVHEPDAIDVTPAEQAQQAQPPPGRPPRAAEQAESKPPPSDAPAAQPGQVKPG
jgi:sec-independent protein translocase protein TatA